MSWLKRLFFSALLAAATCAMTNGAQAQTSPGFVQYTPLGAVQLNTAFQNKLDYGAWSGGTLCGIGLAGTTLCSGVAIQNPTITGATITTSSVDSSAIGQTTPAAGAFTIINGYGVETVNLNASLTPPAAMGGTGIQFVQADATVARIEADSFGNFAAISANRYDGTGALPTAVQSGEETGGFAAGGYDGTTLSTGGKFRCYAAQNQAVGAHGTTCAVAVTANGSTTLTDQLQVFQDGGVTVGAPTGGDKGAGSLNVGTLYLNGTAAAAASTTPWTPVVTFATPGNLAVTYSTQVAQTVKTGSVCVASFRITTSAFTFTTASGNFNITGLSPTPNSTYASASSGQTPGWSGLTSITAVPTNIVSSSAVISLVNANGSPLTTANFTTTTNIALSGNLTYPC